MNLYQDKEFKIFISDFPSFKINYPICLLSPATNKKIKKKPLEVIGECQISVLDLKTFDVYVVELNNGYTFDGATIPMFLWNILGSNTNCEYILASAVHDIICGDHSIVNYNRKISSKIFRALLISSCVPKWKATIMYLFVDFYQKYFVNWKKPLVVAESVFDNSADNIKFDFF